MNFFDGTSPKSVIGCFKSPVLQACDIQLAVWAYFQLDQVFSDFTYSEPKIQVCKDS